MSGKTTLSLTVPQLHQLLAPVVPLASADGDIIPVLNAVHLRTVGKQLLAEATDRYRAGCTKVELEKAPRRPLDVVLPLPAAKYLLHTWRAKMGRNHPGEQLTLQYAPCADLDDNDTPTHGGILTVTGRTPHGHTSLQLELHAGTFPDVAAIIREGLQGTKVAAIRPELFAGFAAAAAPGVPLELATHQARQEGSPRRLHITAGDAFVGVLMPVRSSSDEDDPRPAEWAKLLGDDK